MPDQTELGELVAYLVRSSRLSPAEASRVVNEVIAFLDETVDDFIRRRHLALQAQGRSNSAIFAQIASELGAAPLSRARLHRAADPASHLRLTSRRSEHVRNRRLHRQARRGPDPHGRAASTRISRLRLGGHRLRAQQQAQRAQGQRQGARAGAATARAAEGHAGHRAHALGDARRAERSQRSSALRRREPLRDRSQRHHRERRAAAHEAAGRRRRRSSPKRTPKCSRT